MQTSNNTQSPQTKALLPILWRRFKCHHCQTSRAQIIEAYAYLCKVTAQKLIGGFSQQIDVEDLIGAGYVALVRAADQFEPRRGVLFPAYAITLIRGAIFEMLREGDWVPRLVREQQKQIARAEDAFEKQHGRQATEADMADALGWSEEYLEKARQAGAQMQLLSLQADTNRDAARHDEPVCLADTLMDASPAPWEQAADAQRARALQQAIARLPPREAKVVALYHLEGKTYREIGPLIGVSDTRAYQLHKQALHRLRVRLDAEWEG